MSGILLLSDGTKFAGELEGAASPVTGWLTANTAVVGFQEMLTDPVYQNTLLAFTYPEVGNVGVTKIFSESQSIQPKGLIVRELCKSPSHYRAEGGFEEMLSGSGVPCLTGVDTRGLAVHLRKAGEMPAVIAPAGFDERALIKQLANEERPQWEKIDSPAMQAPENAPEVAVIDLGMRSSFAKQLCRCCKPARFSHDAVPDVILKNDPGAVIVTDGPSFNYPPQETVETIKNVCGRLPLLACGLGNIALGLAMGAKMTFLERGHHGANYPVRRLSDGKIETTRQQHSVILDRKSVEKCGNLNVSMLNVNDASVEGVMSEDGSAIGYQALLPVAGRSDTNRHLLDFIESINNF